MYTKYATSVANWTKGSISNILSHHFFAPYTSNRRYTSTDVYVLLLFFTIYKYVQTLEILQSKIVRMQVKMKLKNFDH